MFLARSSFRRSPPLSAIQPPTTETGRHQPPILVEPLIAVLLWAGTFTAGKLGFESIPVFSFTGLRLVAAGVLFLALVGGFGWLRDARAAWRPLLNAGLAQTAFQILLLQGLQRTSASSSAILLATSPLIAAAWLGLTRRQSLRGRHLLGLVVGLAGVLLVIRPDTVFSGEQTWVGNLIAFGAAIAWAWYSLAIGPASRAVGSLRASGVTVVIAAVCLIPTWVVEATALPWDQVSAASWLGLIYGASLGLVVATVLWVRSIERWGATATIPYGYLEPVGAILIAALLLGESLAPIQAVGGVLALVGVWLASAPPGGGS